MSYCNITKLLPFALISNKPMYVLKSN
ncbi:MAG: hypothetical protein ACI81T_004025, partial [Bacteroidia bacterium]